VKKEGRREGDRIVEVDVELRGRGERPGGCGGGGGLSDMAHGGIQEA